MVNPSNILWKDSTGVIRKWIDQRTGDVMKYDCELNYAGLPESLQAGMKRYIEQGIAAGGFLTACLENNLVGAFGWADVHNRSRIQEIVYWLYNEAPSGCWGSAETVAKWLGHYEYIQKHKGT